MKNYGLTISKEEYSFLCDKLGKIRIRVIHGSDVLYVLKDGHYQYCTCNIRPLISQLKTIVS